MAYDIFISYRRLNSNGLVEGRDIARLLMKELKLYGYNVFFDYSEIKDNDFEQAILPAIRNCKVFILILTEEALTRCTNTQDWVRREILEAHKCNKKIITINPGYSFKSFPENNPKELKFLETIQMSSIDVESNFEITVEKMVNDRISTIIPRKRLSHITITSDNISTKIGNNIFEIPDEYFNEEVYKALKRAYVKN